MVNESEPPLLRDVWPYRSVASRESWVPPDSVTRRQAPVAEVTNDVDTDVEDDDLSEDSDGVIDHDGSHFNDESAGRSWQDPKRVDQYRIKSQEDQTVDTVPARSTANSALADAVGEFFGFLCSDESEESISSSTLLVYFCGTLGFSPEGLGFESKLHPQTFGDDILYPSVRP